MDQRHRYPVEFLTSSRAMRVSMFSEVSVLQDGNVPTNTATQAEKKM